MAWSRILWTGYTLLLGWLLVLQVAFSAEENRGEPPQGTRLRSVVWMPESRELVMTGWVNQVNGLVEFLACGPGGKTHESVLVLSANPVDVQAASLLLGWKPTGSAWAPEGNYEMWVEWTHKGRLHRERGEHLVYDLEEGGALPSLQWIFTGSTFKDGQYMALVHESLVAVYGDEWAVFNLVVPYSNNDERLVVNDDLLPPIGTPVSFIIRAGKKED